MLNCGITELVSDYSFTEGKFKFEDMSKVKSDVITDAKVRLVKLENSPLIQCSLILAITTFVKDLYIFFE